MTWTPEAGLAGQTLSGITFSVSDGALAATRVVAFQIVVINNAPVFATLANFTVNELAPLTFSTAATDADPGSVLSYRCLPGCPSGVMVNPSTGAVAWTPQRNQVGVHVFELEASDGSLTARVSANVTVNNVAPTFVIADKSVIEDQIVSFTDANIEASDEGTSGSYSFNNPGTTGTKCSDRGTLGSLNTTTGSFTFTPAANWNGSCAIRLNFDDGNGASASSQVSVVVSPVDDAPTLSIDGCSGSVAKFAPYTCTPVATNPDAGTLSWSLDAANTCAFAAVNATTGNVTGTPQHLNVGACSLVVRVVDSSGNNVVTQAKALSVTNSASSFTLSNRTILEDTTLVVSDAQAQASTEGLGLADYAFDDAGIVGTKCSDNGTLGSLDTQTGAFTFLPAANWNGNCIVRLVFDDGFGLTTPAQMTLTVSPVDDNPVLSQSCPTAIDEDTAYSCTPTATNPDSGTLSWSKDSLSSCNWASVNSTSGAVGGTPNNADVGSCDLVLRVTDSVGNNNVSQTVTVAVGNAAPALSISDKTTNEDTALVVSSADVAASDEAQGAGALYSFSQASTTAPRCSDNGSISATNATTGAFTYTPSANSNGVCNVRVTFTDGTASAFDEFAVTVNAVDDLPVIVQSCAPGTLQDVLYSCGIASLNPDGGTLTWSKAASSTCGSWVNLSGTGASVTLSGTPSNSDVGSCTVDVSLGDSVGNNTVEQTVSIVVDDADDLPVAVDFSASTAEDTAVSISIAPGAMNQYIDPDGDLASAISVRNAADGAIGAFTCSVGVCSSSFTPAANFSGSASFEYRVSAGASQSALWSTVTISVSAVDDAPVISQSCQTSVNQDAAYSCSPSASNPDSGTLAWSKDAASTCAWASVNSGSGAVTGTPSNAQVGACTVVLKVNDSMGSNDVMQTVNVSVANVAPTFSVTNQNISEDGTLTLADAAVQASEEGQGATVYTFDHAATTGERCADVGSFGSLDASTGALSFTPTANWNGICNVRLSFADGNGAADAAQFALTVTAVNDAPLISQSCAVSVNEDATYSCAPTATNPDGGTLTWSKEASSTCAWATVSGTGGTASVGGTPNNTHVGSCSIVLNVTDSAGADAVTQSFNVTLSNVAPTLTVADQSTNEDTALVLSSADVVASDEAQGAGALYSFSQASTTVPRCSDNGAISDTNTTTGVLTYTPSSNFNGSCNIRVTFTDGIAAVFDEFAVTVVPVEDPIQGTVSCNLPNAIGSPGGSYSIECSGASDVDAATSYEISSSTGSICPTLSSNGTSSGTFGGTTGTCTYRVRACQGGVCTAESSLYSFSVYTLTTSLATPSLNASCALSFAGSHTPSGNISLLQFSGNTGVSGFAGTATSTSLGVTLPATTTPGAFSASWGIESGTINSASSTAVFSTATRAYNLARTFATEQSSLPAATTYYTATMSGKQVGLSNLTGCQTCSTQGLEFPYGMIAGGQDSMCTMNANNRVYCWGSGANGKMGSGNTSNVTYPTEMTGWGPDTVAIAVGSSHMCRISDSNSVYCLGSRSNGQVGDGVISGTPLMTQYATIPWPGSNNVVALSTFKDFTCALRSTGLVSCWGKNDAGQVGTSASSNRSTPYDIPSGTLSNVVAISTGERFTCALTSAGAVWCFGGGALGQLGNGASPTSSTSPVQVTGLTSGVVQIANGEDSACALKSDGTVVCWGNNSRGQLGNNSTTTSNVPVNVSIGSDRYVQLKGGNQFNCGLLTTGGVKCWGDNDAGQLGDGTLVQKNVPTQVVGLTSGVAVIGGGLQTPCAILHDGRIMCWGSNGSGQVGNGNTTNQTSPTFVKADASTDFVTRVQRCWKLDVN